MSDDKQKDEKTKRTHAVIDRIEDGGHAVIQFGDDSAYMTELPVELLPGDASDGDHIVITVRLERESRAAAEERIRAMQERLERRSRGE